MKTQECRVCQVPLEGARELDEGRGDICMSCKIDDLSSRLRKLEQRFPPTSVTLNDVREHFGLPANVDGYVFRDWAINDLRGGYSANG